MKDSWTEKRNEVIPALLRILKDYDLTVSEAKSFLNEALRVIDDKAKIV